MANVKQTKMRRGFDKNGKRIGGTVGTRSNGPPSVASAKNNRQLPIKKKATAKAKAPPSIAKAVQSSAKKVVAKAQAKALGAEVIEKVEPSKARRFWTAREDELLCKAYVNVSADPAVGNNQTAPTFWKRVNDEFGAMCLREIKKDYELWVWDSIRSRFQRHLQKNTNKFIAYHQQATKLDKSGWTEDMYLNQAKEIYLEMEGKPHKHVECFKILRSLPKFNPSTEPQDEDAGVDGGEDDEDDGGGKPKAKPQKNPTGTMSASGIPRPPGVKKAKAARAASVASEAISSAQVTAMQGMSSSSLNTSVSVERRRQIESCLKRSKMHYKMGKMAEAMSLVKEADALEDSFKATSQPPREIIRPSPLTLPTVQNTSEDPQQNTSVDHLDHLDRHASSQAEYSHHDSQPTDDSREVKNLDKNLDVSSDDS